MSAVVLFLSVVIMLFSGTEILRVRTASRHEKNVLLVIIFSISIVLLFVLGEEISWGQRIFGWQSTGIFKEQNFQGETNLHNFINPILPLFYPLVGITSFLIMFLYWVFPRRDLTILHRAIIPPESFFVLFFMMAGVSFNGQSELYESLLALFAFLYSIRVFCFLKFSK